MKICLLEPFHTGSHAAWGEEYARYSRHDVELFTLSGRRWKWRMHGGAVTLARHFMNSSAKPDLLLASDMLDLTTFLALTRKNTAKTPSALYFHENQLTYPWSSNGANTTQQRAHYAFINYASALTADAVFFNSKYHMEVFTKELPRFLKSFPDQNEIESVDVIKEKSAVLPLGLDLQHLDTYQEQQSVNAVPLILWNHRWEYDKNPEEFFQALYLLQEEGCEFNVVILGESYRTCPPIFSEARQKLGDRVVQFGYAKSFADYASWLWRADVLPVHSHHDFFGASVVQAIYCGCTPLLPNRLAYPEHLPETMQEQFLYQDFDDLLNKLRNTLKYPDNRTEQLQRHVSRYDWQEMVKIYDDRFERVVSESSD